MPANIPILLRINNIENIYDKPPSYRWKIYKTDCPIFAPGQKGDLLTLPSCEQ